MSLKNALFSRIASLSGPIWDRANRVAQACRLERIVPKARPPNWPYRRLDRSPLSVPLGMRTDNASRGFIRQRIAMVLSPRSDNASRGPEAETNATRGTRAPGPLLFL